MNTTHQRLQALEGRNGCLRIQTHSHNHVFSLRSSGTFAGAGFNLSYRVLHPSGIGFVSEFGTGESGKMELTGTSDLFLWELNLQPKKAERLQKSP